MDTTQFALTNKVDIHALGSYVEDYVNKHWDRVFQINRDEMITLYDKMGDAVYGLYGKRLYQALHDQFKQVGLQATPRLPGGLMISREWGPEDERQRWMWSKITTTEGVALGTIVVIFFHDHLQIRIPRASGVIALEETTKRDVVAALSQRSAEFADAIEMKDEVWEE